MKKSLFFISLLILCCLVVGTASASEQGGLIDGTYYIYDADDLNNFASYVNGDITHIATNAQIMDNIELSGLSQTSIGSSSNKYAGTFNGNGYEISGISLNNYFMTNGATIKNTKFNISIIIPTTSSYTPIQFMTCSNSEIYSCIFTGYIKSLDTTYSYAGVFVSSSSNIHDNIFIDLIINPSTGRSTAHSRSSIFSNVISNGYIRNNWINNVSAIGSVSLDSAIISHNNVGSVTITNNFVDYSSGTNYVFWSQTDSGATLTASSNYRTSNTQSESSSSPTGQYGELISDTAIYTQQGFYDGTSGYLSWDFSTLWYWDNTNNIPKLKVFQFASSPVIQSVLLLSSNLSTINAPIVANVSAISPTLSTMSYSWLYSIDSGQNWTIISNESLSPLVSYIPTIRGTYLLKVIVSDDYGYTDSYDAGFDNIIISVLNVYVPDQVTTKISSVQAKTLETYQATNEFDFINNIKDVIYKGDTIAYVAAGNAIYIVNGEESTISPLTEYTGNTISKVYFGDTRAIINDIDNNVAIYDYYSRSMEYIATNGTDKVAISPDYAYIVNDTGWLNIYDLNNTIIAYIQYTYPYLEVNQATNIIGYMIGVGGQESSYSRFYYLIYDGTTITPAYYDYQWSANTNINAKPVGNTDKWITYNKIQSYWPEILTIKSDGTASNTVVINTQYLIGHIDVSESLSSIFNVNSIIYVYGNDAQLQGQYTAGGNLNDVSIAYTNGLYAIAGGNDTIAYFINKESSSSWILDQATNFGEAIYYSKISYDGNQALIGTTNKLFLFKYQESVDSNYYINGVVVGSDGLPYANKIITIDANSVTTDDSGFFVYPVKPGQTYTIITGTKTTRYTATNQALQTLSIKIQSQLISQDVTYGATYNQTSRNIEMTYNDAVDRTSIVVWSVRDTHTGQEVSRQTVQAGDPAFYFVPTGKENDNYFVTVNADRGNTTVKNTWSITPSGEGQTVNLFGMDETGRNILFGFFLILLAGLFGYLHQHIGTIIIALAAAILRYLGLITVPWIMILIAVVVAIVAAIAHRGEGK